MQPGYGDSSTVVAGAWTEPPLLLSLPLPLDGISGTTGAGAGATGAGATAGGV